MISNFKEHYELQYAIDGKLVERAYYSRDIYKTLEEAKNALKSYVEEYGNKVVLTVVKVTTEEIDEV